MSQDVHFTYTIGTAVDAAPMAALHAACFATGWSEESISDFLADTGILVHKVNAALANALAGFVIARGTGDEAEILTLAIDAKYRRRGLAQTLLDKTSTQLAASGVERLFLEVDSENDAAIALYKKHGFAQVGRRRNYYRRDGHPARDALCLSLNLAGT